MPVGILTAALQELTPREIRDADPDRAIEDWLVFARELGADIIQLSAALHPSVADVPPEAMLDPVANTLDLREPFDAERARRVLGRLRSAGVRLSDLGYFDNMLHDDAAIRRAEARVHAARLRCGGAAGRHRGLRVRRPQPAAQHGPEPRRLRGRCSSRCCKEAKARGLTYRVEQCPMPGWTTGDNFHNNIAYAPGTWIALHRICERHGVGDQFRIHYDPSHAILMGQDSRSIFQYLRDAGYPFLIGGFHVKGQVIDAQGRVGLGLRRPDDRARRLDRRRAVAASRPIRRTPGRSRPCSPSTSCRAPLGTIRSPTCRTALWTGSITSSRHASCCRSTSRTRRSSSSTIPAGARPGPERLKPILQGSIAFVRHIDRAGGVHVRAAARRAAAQGIPIQGIGRRPIARRLEMRAA